MKVMNVVIILFVVMTIICSQKESSEQPLYLVDQMKERPPGYESEDTSFVWKISFLSLPLKNEEVSLESLDCLIEEGTLRMEQFIFFANLKNISISGVKIYNFSGEERSMTFLCSISQKISKKVLEEILYQSFFGTDKETEKADSRRLFSIYQFAVNQQEIHILPRYLLQFLVILLLVN
jgi:hypothetical protein